MELGPKEISRKIGIEFFRSESEDTEFRLLEFWQWATSDLLTNTTRGILAEYIVATDLGVAGNVRNDWEPYDLTSKDGIKIEVKTSAYLQTWYQSKLSLISFDIKATIKWNPKTNRFEGKPKRQSDFYVFCLLHHKDKKTVDPLNLDQWTFYVLATSILNLKVPNQKSISLGKLLKLEPVKCQYGQIRKELENYGI